MNDLRTAAQQALEAWDKDENGTVDHPMSGVMETLRAALEGFDALFAELTHPEQEPVAWMYVNSDGECEQIEYGVCDFDDQNITLLYTHPPHREWQGLTDEEAAACWSTSAVETWKAIEAALKEKNK